MHEPAARHRAQLFSNRYRVAAYAYLAYAVVYFFGAMYQMTPGRQINVFGVPWWTYFILGAMVGILFSIFVWYRFKWFTRILFLGPLIKASALLWRILQSNSLQGRVVVFELLFTIIALVTAALLFRAGWGEE